RARRGSRGAQTPLAIATLQVPAEPWPQTAPGSAPGLPASAARTQPRTEVWAWARAAPKAAARAARESSPWPVTATWMPRWGAGWDATPALPVVRRSAPAGQPAD